MNRKIINKKKKKKKKKAWYLANVKVFLEMLVFLFFLVTTLITLYRIILKIRSVGR